MTAGVLLVHGFHPWAEDGGLYVAGVESLLNPQLFPGSRAFVAAPMRFSVFAPCVAFLVRLTHASLAGVLLGLYLFTAALMLFGALRLARRCFPGQAAAPWFAVTLLATWWTLPVAGTSLLLVDPYLTARSFSTPITLLLLNEVLALAELPRNGDTGQLRAAAGGDFRAQGALAPGLRLGFWLVFITAFHPLMAIYALGFGLVLFLVLRRAPWQIYVLFAGAIVVPATGLQVWGAPDSPSATAAVFSRYYWFLSQWQWYERLGLAGPLLVLALLRRKRAGEAFGRAPAPLRALCSAGLVTGLFATALAPVFAQQHFAVHAVARLQPLRAFLPIYALLPILLGGTAGSALLDGTAISAKRLGPASRKGMAATGFFVLGISMFLVQRATFPASPHIEWPGRSNPNPWVQAFLWIQANTPVPDNFALDARYVNLTGEDAQSFRAIAQRSALPDFSKDGGEAANDPLLAPSWQQAAAATAGLSRLSDDERAARLRGLGVQWVVLEGGAETALPCPYRNQTAKVCRFSSP